MLLLTSAEVGCGGKGGEVERKGGGAVRGNCKRDEDS